MHLTLLTVGKTDIPWVRDGLEMYVSRLKHYVPFGLREIPELKGVSALNREQIKEKEGELILRQLKPADDVILLDEHGREFRSLEFADWLGRRLTASGHDLVFVVGGAYGFSDAVYARAAGKLSLSKMTYSHQLVRTIFAEQLYRAFTILRGEPYHHE
ncbi:MAG: 23S rRNA (pseudouridine(1915)-N(3))-methyltransferase RlmH [Bacteroidales bacterium]|nr:23S rRNA (pseudouridine(1915)-N(3))-methyltransferase RlmH [Bacteroidales bacterium]